MTSTQSSPIILAGSKIPVHISVLPTSRGTFGRTSLRSNGFTYASGFHSADSSPNHHPHYHNHSRLSLRSRVSCQSSPVHKSYSNPSLEDDDQPLSPSSQLNDNQNHLPQVKPAVSNDDRSAFTATESIKNDFNEFPALVTSVVNKSKLPNEAVANHLSKTKRPSSQPTQSSNLSNRWSKRTQPNCVRKAVQLRTSNSLHSCTVSSIEAGHNYHQQQQPHSGSVNGSSNKSPGSLSLSGPNLSASSHSRAKFEAFIMTGDLILSLATSNSRENRLAVDVSPIFNGGRPLRKTQASEINCSQLVKQCLTMDSCDRFGSSSPLSSDRSSSPSSNSSSAVSSPTCVGSPAETNTAGTAQHSEHRNTFIGTPGRIVASATNHHRLTTPNSTGSSAEHSTASTPDEEDQILMPGDFGARLLTTEQLLKAESPHFSQQPESSSNRSPSPLDMTHNELGQTDSNHTVDSSLPNKMSLMNETNPLFTSVTIEHLDLKDKSANQPGEKTQTYGMLLSDCSTESHPDESCEIQIDANLNSEATTGTLFAKRYPSFIAAPIKTSDSVSLPVAFESEHLGEPASTLSLLTCNGSFRSVDSASANRLAKRLYNLDGFRKSDVARHLYKKNDFAQAVASSYVAQFDFTDLSLVEAIRHFLAKFSLRGETQERERIMLHFAKRYWCCNETRLLQQDIGSEHAVNALTCAILLLNSDLHGNTVRRKMNSNEFIANLVSMNDGHDFDCELLRSLYTQIQSEPLKCVVGDDEETIVQPSMFALPDTPTDVIRKDLLLRKCCFEAGGRKTPIGKRSWKPYHATLRNLMLYLSKG